MTSILSTLAFVWVAAGGATVAIKSPSLPPTLIIAKPAAHRGVAAAKLSQKMASLLRQEMAGIGVRISSDEEVTRLRAGDKPTNRVDLDAPMKKLEGGRDSYLFFEFKRAATQLLQAQRAFRAALEQPGAFEAYAESCIYLGAANLGAANQAAAQNSFMALLKYRPDYPIDTGTFAPEVVSVFEAVRAKSKTLPSAALSVSSAPPLASVSVDGAAKGETPLAVQGVTVGEHIVQVEIEGYQAWSRRVVVPAKGAILEVKLANRTPAHDLRSLEATLDAAGPRVDAIKHASALARGTKTASTMVMTVLDTADAYWLVVALLDQRGNTRTVWGAVDKNLFKAQTAARQLVRALASTAAPVPVRVDTGVQAQPPNFDFSATLLGFVPEPDKKDVAAGGGDGSILSSWWFWGGMVAVVGGGAAAAFALLPGDAETVTQTAPYKFTAVVDVQ